MRFRYRGKLGAGLARAFASTAALAAVTGGTVHAAATLDHAPYGMTQDGQAVEIYTMTNEHGLRVRFLSYGGVITEIDAPDRAGRFDNIVLGLEHCGNTRRSPAISARSPAATLTASAVRNSH
jgi:aldose 1-epimerase